MIRQVRVKPSSSKQRLIEEADGSLTVYLRSAPVEGKANAELIQTIAKFFGVSKSAVSIQSGLTARIKILKIQTPEG
jgi:uncharacterized protein